MSGGRAVDVIISNHNYARFLPAAIDSALNQSYPHVRVIVVDDGSTDGSVDVLASYGDRIVAVCKPNGGQASAWNAGFAKSEGDVVVFLDSDDVLLANTVERVAGFFDDGRAPAKVQYRMEVVDADGHPTGKLSPPAHIPLVSGDVRGPELAYPFDLALSATSGHAFPRWVLERLFPVPEDEFRAAPDWYLKHLAALLGDVVSLDWVGALYRVHGANSYAPTSPALDLQHVRKAIRYAASTRVHLSRLADDLRLRPPRQILSVSDAANRLVSRRLDPGRHPDPSDTLPRLVAEGWRASARRSDTAVAVRGVFGLWFLAMALAPQPLARPLAERFLVADRRPVLNRLLTTLRAHEARG